MFLSVNGSTKIALLGDCKNEEVNPLKSQTDVEEVKVTYSHSICAGLQSIP